MGVRKQASGNNLFVRRNTCISAVIRNIGFFIALEFFLLKLFKRTTLRPFAHPSLLIYA